jgi:hypothetical protein
MRLCECGRELRLCDQRLSNPGEGWSHLVPVQGPKMCSSSQTKFTVLGNIEGHHSAAATVNMGDIESVRAHPLSSIFEIAGRDSALERTEPRSRLSADVASYEMAGRAGV